MRRKEQRAVYNKMEQKKDANDKKKCIAYIDRNLKVRIQNFKNELNEKLISTATKAPAFSHNEIDEIFSKNPFFSSNVLQLSSRNKTVEKLLNECREIVLSAKDEEADIILKNEIFLDAKINDLKSNPYDLNEDDMKKVKECITTLEIAYKIIERQNANS